jgi:hypothetical protein
MAIYAANATAAAIASLLVYWPILAIAVVIGLLVAAVVWAYTEIDWFRTTVDFLWEALKKVWEITRDDLWPILKKVAGWFADTFIPKLETLEAQFNAVKDAISTLATKAKEKFDDIKTKLGELKDEASDRIDDIKGFFSDLLDDIKALPGKIKTAAEGLFDSLKDEAKRIFNAIAGLWNDSVGSIGFSVPSWVPGMGGKSFSVPDIPRLHDGGIVPGPVGQEVLALVQAGEMVTPIGDTRQGRQVTVNAYVNDGRGLIDYLRREAALA